MTDIIVAVVGIAVTIVLACFFYWKQRAAKEPRWAIRTNNLVADWKERLPRLAILYEGKPVSSLSVSRVVFWNAGRCSIRKEDIAPADRLRIQCKKDVRILSVSLIESNSPPSRMSYNLEPDDAAVTLEFDFLEKEEGAVFEVVHTGTSSDDIRVAGTIIDGGQPKFQDVRVPKFRGFMAVLVRNFHKLALKIGRSQAIVLGFLVGLVMLATGVTIFITGLHRIPEGRLSVSLVRVIVLYALAMLATVPTSLALGYSLYGLPPRGLQSFLGKIPYEGDDES